MKIYNRTSYDKDLIINYNKYYFKNFLITRFSAMGVIVLGFSVYLFILHQTVYAITLIGIMVAYFILIYLMQIYSTKKNVKSNPIVDNPFIQEYLFSEDEIIMSFGEKISYSTLNRIKYSKQFILLFSKEKKTYIISMSGFQSDSEKETLIQYLKQKTKKKNKSQK